MYKFEIKGVENTKCDIIYPSPSKFQLIKDATDIHRSRY